MLTFKSNLGKDFWRYRIGQIISLIGDQLAIIAISCHILTSTRSSGKMSMIIAPSLVVSLILAIMMGPLGDKFQRKQFIIYGNLFKMAVWLIISVLFWLNRLSFYALMILYLLNAIGSSIADTGSSGILPELVEKNRLQDALSIISSTSSTVQILGGVFAGFIVGLLGVGNVFVLNSLSFLILMLIVQKIQQEHMKIKNSNKYSLFMWKQEFVEGMGYIMNSKYLKNKCLSLIFLQFSIVPIQVAIPSFVFNYLNESSAFLGFVFSAEGFGAIIAPFFLKLLNKVKVNNHISFCLIIAAIALILMGEFINKYFLVFFIVLAGMGFTSASVVFNAEIMKRVSDNYRSRFFTILSFSEGAVAPIGLMVAGYYIDSFGVQSLFWIMGIFLLFLVNIPKIFKFQFQSSET